MGMIDRLVTVNGGKIVSTRFYTVEIMGPGFSTHPIHMVAAYESEGEKKVEVVYDGTYFYVFRFKSYTDLQHYWSKKYSTEYMLSDPKYKSIAEMCRLAYADLRMQIC